MTVNKGRKILYIIFSIIVSIALWAYVVYIVNPVLKEPVAKTNIPIEFTGEEILRDYNLIVSNKDILELSVYFGGRLQDSQRIRDLEVRAVVDLTEVLRSVTHTGTHALKINLIYEDTGINKLTIEERTADVVEVTVEQLVTENIQIKPVYSGSITDGYMAGTLTLSRDTVTVAGTEAAVGRIASATATLKRENISRTVSDTVEIELFDDTGAKIDPSEAGITFVNDTGTVVVTQNILMVKEVPVVIDIVETLSVNDSNISIDYEPRTILLSGDPEELEGYNVCNLGTVDLKSFTTSYNNDFLIRLPNNTNNLSGFTSAHVRIDIKDSNIQIRRLTATNLAYRNADADASVEIITESIDVTIRGALELIDEVMAENIRVVADLSDFAGSKGTFTVPARVYVDGFPYVDAIGEYTVTVFIS